MADGICNSRRLWNGMFWSSSSGNNYHAVHKSPCSGASVCDVPWDFNPVPYCQPSSPTPTEYATSAVFGMACLAGSEVNIQEYLFRNNCKHFLNVTIKKKKNLNIQGIIYRIKYRNINALSSHTYGFLCFPCSMIYTSEEKNKTTLRNENHIETF